MKKLFFPHDHKPEHLKHLDGLRGIAVLVVVLAHTNSLGFEFLPYLNFNNLGRVGVYIFFILSAYLLDRQIINVLKNKKSNYWYWLNYCLRRFLRIFPLFFLALFSYYLLSKVGVKTVILEDSDIWRHLTFEDGKGIFWSVPVEFKYYLISPVLLIICHKIFRWNLQKTLILVIILILFSFSTEAIFGNDSISLIRNLPIFLCGTLIVILETFKPCFFNFNFKGVAFLCIILIILMIPFYSNFFLGNNFNSERPSFLVLYGFLISFIFIGIHFNKGILRSIAELKMFRFFGAISFSLYLFHIAFALIIKVVGIGPLWINIFIYFTASISFSTATYLLIEFPLSKINIKKLMSYKFPGIILQRKLKGM